MEPKLSDVRSMQSKDCPQVPRARRLWTMRVFNNPVAVAVAVVVVVAIIIILAVVVVVVVIEVVVVIVIIGRSLFFAPSIDAIHPQLSLEWNVL